MPIKRRERRRAIVAATVGTIVEHVDLTIYAFMAAALSKVFFPTNDPELGLLITFASYGTTFLVRPLGAAIFGSYADRAGRKKALAIALSLMGFGSLAIGLMPSYATLGIWAPIGVIIAKLVQGFSAGGEQGTAVAFVAEQSSAPRAAQLGWLVAAGNLGQASAAALSAVVMVALTQNQIEEWGWRVPFLVGTLIFPVGLYIRHFTVETISLSEIEGSSHPVRTTFRDERGRLIAAVILTATGTITFYLGMFLSIYASTKLGLPLANSLFTTTASGIVGFVAAPLFGRLADRFGHMKIITSATILIMLLPAPLFTWLAMAPSVSKLLLGQLAFALIHALYAPTLIAIIATLFPQQTRASGVSIALSLSTTLFGGFAPFIFSLLSFKIPNPAGPSIYLIFSAAASAATLMYIRKNRWI